MSGLRSGPRWSTTCRGHGSGATPGELQVLGEHLVRCRAGSDALRRLQRGLQALHRWVAPRLVSTLALAILVTAGALLLL